MFEYLTKLLEHIEKDVVYSVEHQCYPFDDARYKLPEVKGFFNDIYQLMIMFMFFTMEDKSE